MADAQRYLKELKKKLKEYIEQVKSITDNDGYKKLKALLKEIVEAEDELRKDSEIGARYNVVRNQVRALLDAYPLKEDSLQNVSADKSEQKQEPAMKDDEQRVYVYLFNAQGGDITSWHKLLLPSSLAEHSINRPIYVNEEQLRKVLSGKLNPAQHGYFAAVINKNDIVRQYDLEGGALVDGEGHQLLRLKESALKPQNIEYFWHEGKTYQVSKDGYLS
ncbi:MAG: type IVB secretion system protein IcmQ [Gammaproteobacteria bacterium]|nr:type IVB secretion system protein IcmQ [Gammaproteobacteria bacterium]